MKKWSCKNWLKKTWKRVKNEIVNIDCEIKKKHAKCSKNEVMQSNYEK